jgi:hypothetical protein
MIYLFVLYLVAIVLSVLLRFTDSDYLFGILKLPIIQINVHSFILSKRRGVKFNIAMYMAFSIVISTRLDISADFSVCFPSLIKCRSSFKRCVSRNTSCLFNHCFYLKKIVCLSRCLREQCLCLLSK